MGRNPNIPSRKDVEEVLAFFSPELVLVAIYILMFGMVAEWWTYCNPKSWFSFLGSGCHLYSTPVPIWLLFFPLFVSIGLIVASCVFTGLKKDIENVDFVLYSLALGLIVINVFILHMVPYTLGESDPRFTGVSRTLFNLLTTLVIVLVISLFLQSIKKDNIITKVLSVIFLYGTFALIMYIVIFYLPTAYHIGRIESFLAWPPGFIIITIVFLLLAFDLFLQTVLTFYLRVFKWIPNSEMGAKDLKDDHCAKKLDAIVPKMVTLQCPSCFLNFISKSETNSVKCPYCGLEGDINKT